jgi:hypothetical protein
VLDVKKQPENTTDKPIFVSVDPNVAVVDENGVIVATGHGQTVITVTCGNVTKECTVLCTFGEPDPTTEPTEPVPTEPKLPVFSAGEAEEIRV